MSLVVLATGPLATVQDSGRPGWAHLGVPRAGALDAGSAALANRLVGNPADAAVVEATLGGLVVRARRGHWCAVTGAHAPLRVDDRPVGHGRPVWVPGGARLEVGTPTSGVRCYLAVAGGITVEPVLGSRSTDTLAWVGPPPLAEGTGLPVGRPVGPPRDPEVTRPASGRVLRLVPGPRTDWFEPDVLTRLCATTWTVQADSDRIGLRVDGPALPRARDAELPSEGMVLGAVQVPPHGRPVVFLADHPVTGGYPVVAVVEAADLSVAAQLRPGEELRFSRSAQR